MSLQKERREFHRRDCLMLCSCEGGGLRVEGHIVDISYGGAGIVVTKDLPTKDTELLLTTRLPWMMVELRSNVVRVKSGAKERGLAEFGVEFLGTLNERQEKLAYFFPKCNTFED